MISVIIPTYNRAGSILRAVDSVLNQTYKDIELIIVDDCSDDNTQEVIKSLQDERLKYVKHEINKGACVARNTGIELAKGEYIAFQDSDDVWMPEKLQKQITSITENDADLVFCRYLRVENGTKKSVGPLRYNEGFLNPITNLYGIGTQTLLAKADVFKRNQFDSGMPRFQDLECLLRISAQYSIYCMEDVLVEYNLGADSISVNPEKLYTACKLLLKKHPSMLSDYPDMGRSMSRRLLLESEFAKNDSPLRNAMCKMAFRCNPSVKTVVKITAKYLKPNRGGNTV